jgi:hypothetical protein
MVHSFECEAVVAEYEPDVDDQHADTGIGNRAERVGANALAKLVKG